MALSPEFIKSLRLEKEQQEQGPVQTPAQDVQDTQQVQQNQQVQQAPQKSPFSADFLKSLQTDDGIESGPNVRQQTNSPPINQQEKNLAQHIISLGTSRRPELVLGTGENFINMMTGIFGASIGTIAGALNAPFEESSGDAFLDTFHQISEGMTFQPKSEVGKDIHEVIGSIFETFHEWGRDLGNLVFSEPEHLKKLNMIKPGSRVGDILYAMSQESPEGKALISTVLETTIAGAPYYLPAFMAKGKMTAKPGTVRARTERANKVADAVKMAIEEQRIKVPVELDGITTTNQMKASDVVASLDTKVLVRSPEDMVKLTSDVQKLMEKEQITFLAKRKEDGKLELIDKADGDKLQLIQELGDRPVTLKVIERASDIPAETFREIIRKDTQKVKNTWEQSRKELDALEDNMKKGYLARFKEGIIDVSSAVKERLLAQGGDAGRRAVMYHDLIAGANTKAQLRYQMAEDRIYAGLNHKEYQLLDELLASRRVMEVDKIKGPGKVKHPGNTTGAQHKHSLIGMRDALGEEKFNDLWQRSERYFEEMDIALTDMYKEGLISKKEYKALKGTKYEPRKFISQIDKSRWESIGGRKISVYESGLHALQRGDIRAMETNSRLLLSEYLVRMENRIARNKANKALKEFAELVPDNGWVKVIKDVEHTAKGKAKKVHIPDGYARVDVMVEGKQVPMIMEEGLAKTWITDNPQVTAQLANWLRVVSGSMIVRPLATGYNPGFALVNFPRDVNHVFLSTSEHSTFLPKFSGQITVDLLQTMGDAWGKKGRFHDFIKEGGGMNFLTHQGTKIKAEGSTQVPLSRGWRRTKEIMSKLNEFSEVWVRLALRERAIKNGKDPVEATWIARNYLDFSQGGKYTKAADHALPYLNATIQAFRTTARHAKQRPAVFATKVAQLQGVAGSLYLANYYSNPEGWTQVPDRERRENWIIMMPDTYSFIDAQGNKRHMYFKVKKDNTMIPFTLLPELLLGRYMEGRIPDKLALDALKSSSPVTDTSLLPPTMAAWYAYAANHDFWLDEKVWKGPDVPPEQEFTVAPQKPTPGFYKDFGAWTGMSPDRTEAAVRKLAPRNMWTDLAGMGYKQLTEGMTDYDKSLHTKQVLNDMPIMRRVIGLTHPAMQALDDDEDVIQAGNAVIMNQNRTLDNLYFKYKQEGLPDKVVRTWINSMPPEHRERLHKRFETARIFDKIMKDKTATHGVPSRTEWINMGRHDPNTRAELYYIKWRDSDPIGRRFMDKIANQLTASGIGFRSDVFEKRLRALKKTYGEDYYDEGDMKETGPFER